MNITSIPTNTIIEMPICSPYYNNMPLTINEHGIVTEALFGDLVFGRTRTLYKNINDDTMTILTVTPYIYDGYWQVIDSTTSQYYQDRLHPTQKFKQVKQITIIDIDNTPISEVIKQLEQYSSDPNNKVIAEDNLLTIYTYTEYTLLPYVDTWQVTCPITKDTTNVGDCADHCNYYEGDGTDIDGLKCSYVTYIDN